MKKNFTLLTISLVAVLAFWACKKEKGDDGPTGFTVTASNIMNIFSETQVDEVWLSMYNVEDDNYEIIAKAPFLNNGFSITLPANVADKYLMTADDWWAPEVDPSIKITHPYGVTFIAAYKGVEVGYFYLNSELLTQVEYMFSTAPFTITGLDNEARLLYDLNVESGWNRFVVIYDTAVTTFSSTIPSDMFWMFLHPGPVGPE